MDFENGGLDRLQRELYSRNENAVPKEKRTPVEKEEESTVPTSWGDPKKTFELSYESMYKKNNTFFNKFLFGALAFFLVALGIASFIFLGGINMISSNNLSVKIVAPSSVSSGEEFDMGLTIINGNRTDLEGVAININYPDGSKSLVSGQVLSHDRVDIGSVASGGSTDYTVR